MPRDVMFQGTLHHFPDAATDDQIREALQGSAQPTEKSIPGFLGNAIQSASDLVMNAGSAITHPLRTLEAVGSVPIGLAEKAGLPLEPNNQSAKMLDTLLGHFKDRYGSIDKAKETLYQDPAGFMGDLSMAFGGAGAAAGAARLPRVAEALGTAAAVTDPLRVPVAIGGAAADKLAGPVSRGLTKGALRGGYNIGSIQPEQLDNAVKTMNDLGIPFSREGVESIAPMLQQIQQQKLQAVGGPAMIDPKAVELRLDDVLSGREVQVNPNADIRQMEQVRQNFRQATGGMPVWVPGKAPGQMVQARGIGGVKLYDQGLPMTAERAEALKEGTYLTNKYGKDVPPQVVATAEAEKALARGLKEELERQIPELTGLNEQQAKLINLQGVLEPAVNKYLNRGSFGGNLVQNLIGTKDAAMRTGAITGTGAFLHEPAIGASVALLQAVLSDPAVKARLASAINIAQRANPGKYVQPLAAGTTAAGRIGAYTQSLTPRIPLSSFEQ